ncbi:MAG TPA: aminotransferase class V-fold PLP-dependent enzyme [Bryobacteraceae bacterium]|nr:aminotransferase class V-fold PLP-dependent enzyme [Bryobacteraceae bacterium]
MTPDWKALRAEFPALANCTYLNTAAFGQMPRCAADAMSRHLARRDELACSDYITWFDDMDAIRESCARLIHCEASDIAFVTNAAAGLAALVLGLPWRPGDEVLTLEDEFPNQLYVSAVLARSGARLRAVPWSEFYAAVNERTRLAVLSSVNYATGFRPPLEEISQFLRERGALLYVDGSQSVGALQFDIQTVRPSVLCVDAYKWMLSANGAGFLYVDPELRQQLPATVVGWRSDRGWRSVDSLNHGEPVFAHTAEKYEGGMLPFPSLYGMGAVIDLMLQAGPAAIEARVLELAAKTRAMLCGLGAEVNTDESQIVTAILPDRDAGELERSLRERRILVSARHGRLRVSPHFYNDEADLEELRQALLECLADDQHLMQPQSASQS